MKKTITLLSIVLLLGSNIKSQSLNNTTWVVNDTTGIFVSYFSFINDTISGSVDNINYTPFSHFIENGNTCSIIDFPGGICLASDTGKYYFSIYSDTLHFILISDNCIDRSDVIVNYFWTSLTTGIPLTIPSVDIDIFPNPFNDILNIKNKNSELLEIIIYDITSNIILEKHFSNSISQNLEYLPKGIYLYEIRNKNGSIKNGKLIKE